MHESGRIISISHIIFMDMPYAAADAAIQKHLHHGNISDGKKSHMNVFCDTYSRLASTFLTVIMIIIYFCYFFCCSSSWYFYYYYYF